LIFLNAENKKALSPGWESGCLAYNTATGCFSTALPLLI